MLATLLAYKCAWYGHDLIKADHYLPSSKACSACGLVRERRDLGVRTWRCECGAEHDRDHNAAKNLCAAGLAVSAGDRANVCGAGRPSTRLHVCIVWDRSLRPADVPQVADLLKRRGR